MVPIFFRPNIAIWVNIGGPCNRRCWYSLWTFCLFYGHYIIFWPFGTHTYLYCGHLVHFLVIWYILWSFGIFFPVLVCCNEKIWQPWLKSFIVSRTISNSFESFRTILNSSEQFRTVSNCFEKFRTLCIHCFQWQPLRSESY
jgi:hypothetical protein